MTVKMAIFTGDIYHILENLRKDCPIGKMSKKAKGAWSVFLCFTKALGASILEEEGVGAARKN